MIRLACILLLCAGPLRAEILVAAHTIRPRATIGPDDIVRRDIDAPGGLSDPAQVIGLEARVAIYAGRPILSADIGLPAIVERNQTVPLLYRGGGILITAEGRALDRAGPGDVIRVMNTASRATVMARIGADGAAYVSN
ncbi:MAG: flagellar basal body P-ring formation protein FlgA [Limimaricola sp.]|uniref:flagellar basal body P-ring formation chaperone FlgA n=1 Tax=Limimaricola sp. TaxID=2211665 RepID=UPI001DD48492|nr:flagellar basal body P-ring formation chaperone FlgA [Limimaricola sp.]MBI1417339.1 flagellar basal body P-ring formation protein FlgA [Limimaricola sp.]